MNLCLHNLWLVISQYNVNLRVVYLKGNVIADALSRSKLNLVGGAQFEVVSTNASLCHCGHTQKRISPVNAAMERRQQGLRPHTVYQYKTV